MREEISVWRTPGPEPVELHRGTGVGRIVPRHWHEEFQFCLVQRGAGELFYRGAHHATPRVQPVHPSTLEKSTPTA